MLGRAQLARLIGAAILCAGAIVSLPAQGTATPDLERVSLATIRWINTAQAQHRKEHGAFGDLQELLRMDPQPPGWPVNERGARRPPPGIDISMVVDRSGQRYSAKVGARESCAWQYLTDESGSILMGRTLGCERDVATRPAR